MTPTPDHERRILAGPPWWAYAILICSVIYAIALAVLGI